jgi:small subunit ribosomal protein S17
MADKAHGSSKKLIGTVLSDRMNKTVVVEVVRDFVHGKYKKYVKERRRYKAHDEQNEYRVGDRVEIQEHRPMSKHKRWVVTRLIVASTERLIADLVVPPELSGSADTSRADTSRADTSQADTDTEA